MPALSDVEMQVCSFRETFTKQSWCAASADMDSLYALSMALHAAQFLAGAAIYRKAFEMGR